jgi:hypothetical protein
MFTECPYCGFLVALDTQGQPLPRCPNCAQRLRDAGIDEAGHEAAPQNVGAGLPPDPAGNAAGEPDIAPASPAVASVAAQPAVAVPLASPAADPAAASKAETPDGSETPSVSAPADASPEPATRPAAVPDAAQPAVPDTAAPATAFPEANAEPTHAAGATAPDSNAHAAPTSAGDAPVDAPAETVTDPPAAPRAAPPDPATIDSATHPATDADPAAGAAASGKDVHGAAPEPGALHDSVAPPGVALDAHADPQPPPDATAAVVPPAQTRTTRAAPSFARAPRLAPAISRKRRVLETAAVGGLLLLLGVQLLLADRARLSADARWRPVVATLCGALGCTLPAWREPSAFRVVERHVRAHGAQVLRVSARIRNDARWAQPWPALQLTLSDAHGRAMATRIFQPREYLGGAPAQSSLGAGQDVALSMDVVEPGPQAVAFTFDFR